MVILYNIYTMYMDIYRHGTLCCLYGSTFESRMTVMDVLILLHGYIYIYRHVILISLVEFVLLTLTSVV